MCSQPPSVTENLHVRRFDRLITPSELKQQFPLEPQLCQQIVEQRATTKAILSGQDKRLLVTVGPCSIHDYQQALEYAHKLAELRQQVAQTLEIHMRVYVDKPRTTIGWRGYLIDPHMDGSNDLNSGLSLTRKLMLEVSKLGLPVATELLDPFAPQYLFDVVSWACLGARTTESQTHRVMASAVSAPMGYKNGTGGNIKIAVDAIVAASKPHAFFSIDDEATACIVHTTGNPCGHVILRGSKDQPNYAAEYVQQAAELMQAADYVPSVMIDCSHANSQYDHTQQADVLQVVLAQICQQQQHPYPQAIRGVMLESNLMSGKQNMPATRQDALHGVSVTDACLGWDETAQLLLETHQRLLALQQP